jgi:hypothetical protein
MSLQPFETSVVRAEWLDLAHRVAPALILKARECLTTALSIMAEKNGTIVELGRGTCAGCEKERHQDTPMLTCSGCSVAR